MGMVMRAVFLLLFARSVSLFASPCDLEQSFCNCSRLNLSKIPEGIPEFVTELDLSFNQLDAIMDEDLSAHARLRSLIMNNNRIQTIQDKALHPLIHLERLDVSFNSLHMLSSSWFLNLPSLQYLNLLGNKYQTLGPVFQPLSRLRFLHLGGPLLLSLKRRDFAGLSGLEELVLDGRSLRVYEDGSLKQTGSIRYVTLNLKHVFVRHPLTVQAILSDVVHPNTTLTFTDTHFGDAHQMSPFQVVSNLHNLVFRNVTMSTAACMTLLNVLSQCNITILTVEDSKIFPSSNMAFDLLEVKTLKEVVFKSVNNDEFYTFPLLNFEHSVVRRATVQNCKLYAVPCKATKYLTELEFLDISDNMIIDLMFANMMCWGSGVMLSLQTINASRNQLQSVNSELFTKLTKLKNIDLSGNYLRDIPETCYWPESLGFLNLSSTLLTRATRCLPASLRILDLSNNKLIVFDIDLPFLTDLYLFGNKFQILPEGRLFPRLTFLSVQNNKMPTFSRDDLRAYKELARLEAAENPYVCSCGFVEFVKSDLMKRDATVDAFVCESPDAQRKKRVTDVRLSVFECHTALAFGLLCSGVVVLCLITSALCYRFSVVWYVRMTCAWLRAKRKPKLKKGKLEFDAFVSYSNLDRVWVETYLVPALERSDPPLRLCLHQRDFVPGQWILDNIMDAVEKSRRTLFVLSQHFVRSEWCKYELDYTHFRLFDQNDDSVVLILLEPIEKNSVPKKFSRLRRALNSRTYLEWPNDDNEIPFFWQSLRTALKRPETVMEANEDETHLL